MRFGYAIPNNQGVASVRDLIDLAVHAESARCNSVWVSEHLFHATYVESRLGDKPYHEALTVLTAVACATSRVRLGTSVLVLPWHHPARLGKTLATLDHLSEGRVDLGVGVAVTEDEFENLGIDFHTRGALANDILAALHSLFTQEKPEHAGPFFSFSGLRFEPKPIQEPLPVHVGGGSNAALERVAEFGHGWHALGKSPNELAADLKKLEACLESRGRLLDEIHVSVRCQIELVDQPWDRPAADRRTLKGTEDEIQAVVNAYADAGVDEIVVDPNSPDVAHNKRMLDLLVKWFP